MITTLNILTGWYPFYSYSSLFINWLTIANYYMKETEILEYTLLKHDYLIDVNMNNYEIIEFKQ